MFCSGITFDKNKDNDIKPKAGIGYVLVDNTNTPIYQKVDLETGEKSTISIFDDMEYIRLFAH